MTTDRKTFSNRQNALSSTGPKTDAGKARSALNAIRHGLSAGTAIDAAAKSRIDDLASLLAQNDTGNPVTMDLAQEAAEAQIKIERIRTLRAQIWDNTDHHSSINKRVDKATKELTKLVRYERQAANQRDKAMRELEEVRRRMV